MKAKGPDTDEYKTKPFEHTAPGSIMLWGLCLGG